MGRIAATGRRRVRPTLRVVRRRGGVDAGVDAHASGDADRFCGPASNLVENAFRIVPGARTVRIVARPGGGSGYGRPVGRWDTTCPVDVSCPGSSLRIHSAVARAWYALNPRRAVAIIWLGVFMWSPYGAIDLGASAGGATSPLRKNDLPVVRTDDEFKRLPSRRTRRWRRCCHRDGGVRRTVAGAGVSWLRRLGSRVRVATWRRVETPVGAGCRG